MHINQIISSIDTSSGGPARSVTHLVSKISTFNENFKVDIHTGKTTTPIINSFISKNAGLYFYEYNFIGGLKNLKLKSPDILHGHGLWQQPVHQMAKYARKHNIPYIISPRGMLEPWSLSQAALKKKLALKLYQHKDLKEAACIHATADMEAEHIRKLGFKNPIAVIPNGVNMDEFPDYKKEQNQKRKVLFLSRIHPKKGIELLIQAWKELDHKITQNWQVEIVGNGEPDYIEGLNQMIQDLKLEQVISISAPVFGDAKIQTYQSADLFVLPTYSENFGIVVAEALALKVPVITTKGTPWEDLETYHCGAWIDIGKDPLKQALAQMLSKPTTALEQLGLNGRKLIEDKYSMTSVAEQMSQLYQWILYKTKKPEFMYD